MANCGILVRDLSSFWVYESFDGCLCKPNFLSQACVAFDVLSVIPFTMHAERES